MCVCVCVCVFVFVCVCLFMCVCVRVHIVSSSFIIPLERSLDAGFKLYIEIDQVDFPDWINLLPSNFMEEINPNPEALSSKT